MQRCVLGIIKVFVAEYRDVKRQVIAHSTRNYCGTYTVCTCCMFENMFISFMSSDKLSHTARVIIVAHILCARVARLKHVHIVHNTCHQ